MADEPRKIFDLMDTETEPTDGEATRRVDGAVGERTIRAETAEINAIVNREIARVMEQSPILEQVRPG